MNLADAVVSGGVTLATLLISWAVKALFARDRDRAAGLKDTSDAFARERETWRTDYNHAYNQVKSQCDECLRRVDRVRGAFDGLLDELEDQVLPALMLPQADPAETARVVRAAMNHARKRVREGNA